MLLGCKTSPNHDVSTSVLQKPHTNTQLPLWTRWSLVIPYYFPKCNFGNLSYAVLFFKRGFIFQTTKMMGMALFRKSLETLPRLMSSNSYFSKVIVDVFSHYNCINTQLDAPATIIELVTLPDDLNPHKGISAFNYHNLVATFPVNSHGNSKSMDSFTNSACPFCLCLCL